MTALRAVGDGVPTSRSLSFRASPQTGVGIRLFVGAEQEPRKTGRQKAAWHKKTHGFACVYPAEIDRKNAHMRQHAGVFAANFSSNLLWQNCFAPKKSAFCAEPRRVAAGILDVCQGGATMGLRETRLLRRMFSYVRRPKGFLFLRLFTSPLCVWRRGAGRTSPAPRWG